MKNILIIIVICLLFLVACDSAARQDQVVVDTQQRIYQQAQPIPRFDFSLERDVMIRLYKARNEANSTYTVVVSSFGTLLWECPSIGYPIAADVQLTNPLQTIGGYSESSVVEQPEPNGLFSSKNTVGTWVMCVLDDGTIYPVYTEMNANAFPFPVKMEGSQFVRADGSAPTVTLNMNR